MFLYCTGSCLTQITTVSHNYCNSTLNLIRCNAGMLGKISEVENTLVCYLAGKSLPVSILKRQAGATIV